MTGSRRPEPGGTVHMCFGEGDNLQIFDVWESQEEFDEFGATLMPILYEKGIDPFEAVVAPLAGLGSDSLRAWTRS